MRHPHLQLYLGDFSLAVPFLLLVSSVDLVLVCICIICIFVYHIVCIFVCHNL